MPLYYYYLIFCKKKKKNYGNFLSESHQQEESKIIKKLLKKPREAVIADSSIVGSDLSSSELAENSVVIDVNEGMLNSCAGTQIREQV